LDGQRETQHQITKKKDPKLKERNRYLKNDPAGHDDIGKMEEKEDYGVCGSSMKGEQRKTNLPPEKIKTGKRESDWGPGNAKRKSQGKTIGKAPSWQGRQIRGGGDLNSRGGGGD